MDRTKAAEILHKAKVCYATEYLDCHMVCDMCKYHVEDSLVVEAIDTAIKALDKDIDVPSKWIPVSERLPEKEDCPMDCLVTRKSKTIGNYTDMAVAESDGTWTHEDWKAITFGDRMLGKKAGLISTRDDDIVAWMPLPEPYKEGE